MNEKDFPIFCQLTGGCSYYRIDSVTHMTEFQQIGSRYAVHELEAKILPERHLINDMIEQTDRYVRISKAHFDERVAYMERELTRV